MSLVAMMMIVNMKEKNKNGKEKTMVWLSHTGREINKQGVAVVILCPS